jgi:alkylated DNA nucleotide flippase Atl1
MTVLNNSKNMQRTLLSEEWIEFPDDGRVDMKKYGWMGL